MPRSVRRIFFAPAILRLFRDAPHFVRRKELAFFQVHDFAGGDGGFDQIRLAAEKRGDLQNVHDLAGGGGLRFVVNIGQHRHAEFRADFGESFQARLQCPARETTLPEVRLALSKLALKT